ncbi:MAG TPA: sensor histidine kinase [Streptosporangiaceae bacterium]|nr:sensor histidine kinase [Streptosporangiaceae bacterium]
MMVRVYWLIRIAGFALIGILALISPAHSTAQQAVQIACFAVVGLALLAWIAADAWPRYRVRGLPVAFGVMAIAGGLAAVTSGGGQSLVAFACVAAVWAGSETDLPTASAVAAAGIVSIWIAGGIAGSSIGTMIGDPLLIAVCAMIGLQRRSYRVQAEQSAALLAQHERLRAEQRRADVLDERTRIAREIHDVLAHSLGALGIQIQAAKAMLTDHGDADRAVEALTTAQRMAADGLTETRRAVHALRVDTLPLGQELAAVADTHRQRYHVPVTLETSGVARALPPDATLALLRTAQEAMVNAAKHAPGLPVAIRLDYGENDVRLSVVNGLDGAGAPVRNGAGAPVQRPGSTGGYGLTGMRERLRLLNGTLLAGPRENEWAVTAELPLAAAEDAIAP